MDDRSPDPSDWYSADVQTHVELDVHRILNVHECICVLVASYVVHRIRPYHRSLLRRLVEGSGPRCSGSRYRTASAPSTSLSAL